MQTRENKHENVVLTFFLIEVDMHVNNSPKLMYLKTELSEAEAARKI